MLLSDVQSEHVKWMWSGRLAERKITVLDGDPGVGKSSITLDLAARITRGLPWPDGSRNPGGGVVVLAAEDGIADTVRPRFDAAGGDATRVRVIAMLSGSDGDERMPTIPDDLQAVEAAVADVRARLVIVDPLMAYLGRDTNSYRDQDVRRALAPLAALADRCGFAVLIVRHLTKAPGGTPLYRGGGSIGIIGAARIALLAGRDPHDETRCVLLPLKSNLGPPPEGITYQIESSSNGASCIVWGGSTGLRADEVLAQPTSGDERNAFDEACDFLRAELADGPVPAKELMGNRRRQAGIAEVTLSRARRLLGVQSSPNAFGGVRMLSLPSDSQSRSSNPSPDHPQDMIKTDGDDQHCVEELY
ncbi:MAG: AAA family ATPase [Candidatus Dormibacteria bacterium]